MADFIDQARQLSASLKDNTKDRKKAELELLCLLLDVQPQRLVWSKYNTSWTNLLKQEGFCTDVKFNDFRRGHDFLSRQDAQKFGPSVLVNLGKIKEVQRRTILQNLRQWDADFKQRRSWSEYETFIREQRVLIGAGNSINYPSPARMMKYIKVLEAKLKKNGIRLPKKPYADPH